MRGQMGMTMKEISAQEARELASQAIAGMSFFPNVMDFISRAAQVGHLEVFIHHALTPEFRLMLEGKGFEVIDHDGFYMVKWA